MIKIKMGKKIKFSNQIKILIVLSGLMVLFLAFFLISKDLHITKAAPIPPIGASCSSIPVGGIYSCEITGGTVSSPFVLPVSTSPNSLDGTNLTISGVAYVSTLGVHNFNNVTIQDTAIATTSDLLQTSNSINDEPDKKIDWTIEGTLSLSDYGHINADIKGYWGAPGGVVAKGPAKGNPISLGVAITDCAGGGGGLGGNGQNGLGKGSPTIALGGVYGGVNINTLDRGSGGGSATCNNITRSGHTGGGMINIWAKNEIIMSGDSAITAIGKRDGASTITGGGGAGGTIRLKTNIFSSGNTDGSKMGPNVAGGKRGTDTAPNGITNVTPDPAFYNIIASGGSSSLNGYGGGGGGGIVRLDVGTIDRCHILSPNTSIPASCENQDVIIDGATVVVNGSRTFQDVTLENNAVLTHADFSYSNKPYTHIGMNIKARNLTIQPGSKIDVSAKGYESTLGYNDQLWGGGQNGIDGGCGSCTTDLVTGLLNGGNTGGTGGMAADGKGPGAGGSFVGGGGAGMGYRAGGGGAGTGPGPAGTGEAGCTRPSAAQRGASPDLLSITSALNNYFNDNYDSLNAKSWGYGGGGGEGTGGGGDGIAPLVGGTGGGSVVINANIITISGDIYANGDRPKDYSGTPNFYTFSAGGGGAGGSISLQADTINVTGILQAKGGDGRWSLRSICFSGDNNTNSGGGGGGGGLITLISTNATSIPTTNMSVLGGNLDSGVQWPDINEQWGAGTSGLIYKREHVSTPPIALTFSGNIYAGILNIVRIPARLVNGGDIVSQNTGTDPSSWDTPPRWNISGYTNAKTWTEIKNNTTNVVNGLEKYKKTWSPPSLPSTLSDSSISPEGNVYYIENQDLTLSGTFSGKGTLIVNGGNVNITGNIGYSATGTNSFGLVALQNGRAGKGNINITAGKNISGAYFAENSITFLNAGANDLTGLLIAHDITLPRSGTLGYDSNLGKNPPPGFAEILKAIYKEAAP